MVAQFLVLEFTARGHTNIACSHHTTLMVTRDSHLSASGDCIAAVEADVALADLPYSFKAAARNPHTVITLTLEVGPHRFTVAGRGHPNLTYSHPRDMVARRSCFTCSRTLMVGADKVANDIPKEILLMLQSPDSEIKVTLTMRV